MNTRFTLAVAASLAASLPAFAEIKLNDKFSVSGYVSGTAAYTETDGVKDGTMDVDAVKLAGSFALDKVTGTVSLHTFASHEPVVLDAYATYAASATTSVTVGKYLSYLGFEAFDYPNMLQISYANSIGAFIPAYQSGVKVDFKGDGVTGGISLVDSVYGPTYYKGDGTLNNGAGLESYLKFTKGDNTLFAAIAFDNGVGGSKDDRTTFDIWAQTKVGKTTLAAEYCYSKLDTAGGNADGFFWLALFMTPLNDKWTLTGRLSGGEDEALAAGPGPTPTFFKATISPAVTITDNLGLLLEYSHIKYDDFTAEKVHYLAAQVIFKW
ncbi:MAG: hypothetical protein B9S34_12285 [Opitutia bacterium Tous-C1TDCM]|nr:MAG: hypothetical protein B9S34_12285 [Opitutae bacterium Tous-C1TDCM]